MNLGLARSKLIEQLAREIKYQRVLEAMMRVPREKFVPPESQHLAYMDEPLSIGFNQTISQPFIIALMTAALELKGSERVLEIGTGSGYQAAILAELARLVITTERIPALAESAKKVLNNLGYTNVKVCLAGKDLGWSSEAPYDSVIVTAGAPRVPPELLAQLKIGGRMVIPVGSRCIQELYKIVRHQDKKIAKNLGGCRFVPILGNGCWEER